ncbi:hypothetical protein JCM10207_004541 [Rhodosporidiobolus poonsookiae]
MRTRRKVYSTLSADDETPPPVDRLTRLPTELLDRIFSFLPPRHYSDPYLGSTCKVFQPVARRHALSEPRTGFSRPSWKVLLARFQARPALAGLVRTLDLASETYNPDLATLVSLLSHVPNLVTLHLTDKLAAAVFQAPPGNLRLLNVEALYIEGHFSLWSNPFAARHYPLERFSRLRTLGIASWALRNSAVAPPPLLPAPWMPWITSLAINTFKVEPAGGQEFIALLPSLQHLTLQEAKDSKHALTIGLNAVVHPSLLRTVTLSLAPNESPSLFTALARFPHLAVITVNRSTSDPALFATLRSFQRLERINLRGEALQEFGNHPSFSQVEALLTDTSALPSLRTLELGGLNGVPARFVGASISLADDCSDDESTRPLSITPPCVELLGAAERRGVDLLGEVGERARELREEMRVDEVQRRMKKLRGMKKKRKGGRRGARK